jgi:hypothetical protein
VYFPIRIPPEVTVKTAVFNPVLVGAKRNPGKTSLAETLLTGTDKLLAKPDPSEIKNSG